MSFCVLGTGSAHPALQVDNNRLSQMVETSDEWIRTRTGVSARFLCTKESMCSLASSAADAALQNAGVTAGELDLILCGTLGGDYVSPSLACQVQEHLGASCPAFDVNAACSGFIYALDVADGYFARGRVKKALVIGAEMLSRFVNWEDRSTCVLFGDGAGAAVLGEGDGLLAMHITTRANLDVLAIPHTWGGSPFREKGGAKMYLSMNGPEVYKFAVQAMSQNIERVIGQAGLTPQQIDHVLPHQANIRIIDTAAKKLTIPRERYCVNVDRYGNTSAASVAILLDEVNRSGRLKKGDHVILTAFGGGLTTGTCLLRWTAG